MYACYLSRHLQAKKRSYNHTTLAAVVDPGYLPEKKLNNLMLSTLSMILFIPLLARMYSQSRYRVITKHADSNISIFHHHHLRPIYISDFCRPITYHTQENPIHRRRSGQEVCHSGLSESLPRRCPVLSKPEYGVYILCTEPRVFAAARQIRLSGGMGGGARDGEQEQYW